MDGPLRSTRQPGEFGGGGRDGGGGRSNWHYRGGGGGGRNHRGRGGGRHYRGRNRNIPWRGGGGGGGRHHNNRGHHRQPQEPKNRTTINTNNTSTNNNTLENQFRCMITKMTLSSNGISASVKQNIKDLSNLISAQQDTFFNTPDINIYEYIIDCVCNLPNYQDAYATFTISLQKYCHNVNNTKQSSDDDNDNDNDDSAMVDEDKKEVNVIEKCVHAACQRLMNDLLILQSGNQKDYTRSFIRCKYLLRYLSYLSHAGVLLTTSSSTDTDTDTNMNDENQNNKMSLLEFIKYLSTKAISYKEKGQMQQSIILSLLIMETMPYLLFIAQNEIVSLLETLETNIINEYKSGHKPTNGIYSILLSSEINDDDEDSDEEDDDEPCSDTLQDLLRNLKSMIESKESNDDYHEFLPISSSDVFWKDVFNNNTHEVDNDDEQQQQQDSQPFSFNAIPLVLDTSSTNIDAGKETRPCPNPFNGIIYGRFPIFSPTVDDDEDEEEEIKVEKQKDENPYVEHYTTLDKYFLHSSVRDICICYKPQITNSGSTTGDISDVMEQIQSLKECFTLTRQHGIDYGIIECLFGLLLQSSSSESELNFIYVSRILLQYVKSSPMTIPQIVVSAISTILEDLLPSMTPCASHTLSSWLGFHLVNTDFQWPDVLWGYWMQQYVVNDTTTIHNIFVRNVIHVMIRYSDYEIVKGQFKDIPDDFTPKDNNATANISMDDDEEKEKDTEKELHNKMITLKEDSANIATWLCSLDAPPLSSCIDDLKNWRSKLVLSTILQKVSNDNNVGVAVSLLDVQTALERYVPLLNIMMEKDIEELLSAVQEDEDQEKIQISPQISILKLLFESFGSSSSPDYNSSIQSLLSTLQTNKLITSYGLASFVLYDNNNNDNTTSINCWWMIIHNFLQVQLEHEEQSQDGEEDEDGMTIAIDKQNVLLESIRNILKVLVHSSINVLYSSKNDYKLISKIEGLKYIMRQFQFDIYQNVIEHNDNNDNNLLECISVDTIINGLDNSCNGDANDEHLVVQSIKVFVDCLKDGRSAGYVW